MRSGDFQRLFSRNLTKWSSFDSSFPTSLGFRNRPNHGSGISSIVSPAKGTIGRAVYCDLSTMSCTVLMQLLMKATNLFSEHGPKVSNSNKIIRGPTKEDMRVANQGIN